MKIVDVAIGVIIKEGKVLVCRRRQSGPLAGYWEFPGGKCEADESPGECLKRELREELNSGARITHSFATIEHLYPTVHVRLHPFLCSHEGGEPQPLACDELRWIGIAELRDYRFPEANAGLIEEIMKM
jgi:mutator protein MutT